MPTPNKGFPTYAKGEEPWDYNQTFQDIDEYLSGITETSIEKESVSTERGSIESIPASYHVHHDGTTIYAEPQASGLSRQTDTDIESLLETLRDALPPAGNSLEAHGTIYFKANEDPYPGTLNDYAGIVSGIRYVGETVTHSLPNETDGGTNRPLLPGVVFETDNIAFRVPTSGEVSGHRMDWTIFKNLSIVGPDDSTGVAFDLTSTLGNGFVFLDTVSVQEVSVPWKQVLGRKDNVHGMTNVNFARFTGSMQIGRNTVIYGSSALIPADGGQVLNQNGRIVNCLLHGPGNTRPSFRGAGHAVFANCELGRTGSTMSSSQGIFLQDDSVASNLTISGDWNDYETAVIIDGGTVRGLVDQTTSTQSVEMRGSDSVLVTDTPPANGITLSSATRPMHNGRYLDPPTLSLSGSDGAISPTDNSLEHYVVRVDAGGSAVNLTGVDNIGDVGTRVTIIRAGSENVTLQDQSSSGKGSNGFVNDGRTDDTLSASNELATYVRSETHWRQIGLVTN